MKVAIQKPMEETSEGNYIEKTFEAIFLLSQDNNLDIDGVVHLGTLEKAVSDFHPLYKSADCYVAGKVNYLGYTSELKYDTQKQIKDSQSHENLLYVFNGFSESYHLTAQTGYYTAFFEVFSVSKDVLDACGEKNVLKLKKYPENIACLETLDNKVLYEGLTLIKTICVEA
ncbi:hypothetical protein HOC35_06860 [Candidatus Woesearchaeota archaeon]|mgnify:FL=1|jgi:hypothetical protein|nr:hypothetical protein [Candidatus Woesearchaeota archaeon]